MNPRLFRMLLPRSAGGDETEPAVYVGGRGTRPARRLKSGGTHSSRTAPASSPLTSSPWPIMLIFADPRSTIAWGPRNGSRAIAVEGGYRVTGKWDFASGCRQPFDGRTLHVVEADGTLRLNRFGQPTERTLLFPASEATLLDTWKTIGLRGTASDSYSVNDVFGRGVQLHPRGSNAAPRAPAPFMPLPRSPSTRRATAGVALGIARAMLSEFVMLVSRKSPRGLARLAENAVVQADVPRGRRRGSARLARNLIETLITLYAHGDDTAPIEVSDRARVELACTNAI